MIRERTSPELPTLGDGVTLLETTDGTTGALASLVADRVLLGGGTATWVDARGRATTAPLARVAPSARVLERVRVARAFTPWQHLSLLRDLGDAVSAETGLVVLPAFDWFYRGDELPDAEGDRMLAEAAALVADLVDRRDLSVLLTRTREGDPSGPMARLVDDRIECEPTPFGPRFVGDAFETLVYPVGDGLVQTTLAFWTRVLRERHPSLADADAAPEVNALGSH